MWICRIAGALVTMGDPQSAVALQHPDVQTPQTLPMDTHMVMQQLGNLYLLLALVSVAVLYTTSEPKVVRNYLIALALADVGHIYITYLGLGQAIFFNIARWNSMTWGNVGVTSFLLLNRLCCFLGLFGSIKAPRPDKKSQ